MIHGHGDGLIWVAMHVAPDFSSDVHDPTTFLVA
jgi:hypothetical protein